jgi:hypothetical protein
MSDSLPQSTSELLASIEQEWHALMHVVDRLTPQQMTTPDAGGWKDNLAHLGAWMQYMKDAYLFKMPGYQAMGIEQDKWQQLDETGINAVLFERNRSRATADVVDDLKSTYADIVQTLRDLPFADLMKPLRPSGPEKRLVIESVLDNTSNHFHEHRLNIEKAIENKTSEAN